MKLNLEHDYVILDSERDLPGSAIKTNREATDFMIRRSVHAKYGNSKVRAEQRMAGPILTALTKAVRLDSSEVDFTLEQLKTVAKAMEEWPVPGVLMDPFRVLQDHVEDLILKATKTDEAVKGAKNGVQDKQPSEVRA